MSSNKKNSKNDHTRDGGANSPRIVFYPGISNVASTGETTGLIPAIPQSENAREALLRMSNVELPETREKGQRDE